MATHPTIIEGSEDGSEEPVTIHYTRCKAQVGATDGRHGPKLEPDIPAHIEIDYAENERGQVVVLTEAEERAIEDEIYEHENGRYDEPEPRGYHDED